MHFRPRPFATLALATVAVLAATPAVACEEEPATHADSPHQIAITPDCTTAYVTDADGNTVSVIDLTTGSTFAAVAVGAAQGNVAITPDGGQAWISVQAEAQASARYSGGKGWTQAASSAFAEIAIVDTDTNEVSTTIKTAGAASSIAFSSDGSTAYTTSGDSSSTVSAIDTATHKVTSYWGFSSPYDVVASDDGDTLWVSEMHSGKVKKVDAHSGRIEGSYSIGHGKHARGMALSGDGSELYVASPDLDGVVVLDTATGAKVTTVKTGAAPTDVQVTPDGASIVVSATADGSVTAVDAYTYTVTATATVSVTASFTVTLLCDGDTAVVEEDEDDEPVIVDTPDITEPEASPSPSTSTPDCPCADNGSTPQPETSDEPCNEGDDTAEPSTTPEPSTSASAEPSDTPAASEEPSSEPSPSTPAVSEEPSAEPSQSTPASGPAPSASPVTPTTPAEPSPTASAEASAITSPTPEAEAATPAPTASAEAVAISNPDAADTEDAAAATDAELAQTGASPSLAIAATIAAIVLGAGLLIARRRTNAK